MVHGLTAGLLGRRALVVALVYLCAACVSPTPPAGEPIPKLTITLSQVEPIEGVVTAEVEATDFTPSEVRFRLDTLAGAPFHVDTAAPFTAEIDTTPLENGSHTIYATGLDGTYTVVQRLTFSVLNRRNLVFVLVDDLDQTTTPYWDALPSTEALLADQGLTFTNSFAVNPLCCPARASILTGRYPHNTGVFDNSPPDGGYAAFLAGGLESDTVAARLQGAGYRTGFFGKYFHGYENDPTHVPSGWDTWFGLTDGYYDGFDYQANRDGVIETYGSNPEDYQTDVLSEAALDFLDGTEVDDDQPFLVYLSPSVPHAAPSVAPRHADHPFANDLVPKRPNYDEIDVSDKPTWLREGVPRLGFGGGAVLTIAHRDRMGSLLAVDEMIAALVDRLSDTDELANTVIVFTSDQGANLGAHRLGGKSAPYEESIRTPLVVRGPGVRVGTETRIATSIDLTPTMLDLAGLDGADLDGRSLTPSFASSSGPGPSDLLIEYHGTYADLSLHTLADVEAAIDAGDWVRAPTFRAVRTLQHLYVEWYADPDHEYELYDLGTDPYQLTNLVATPEGAQLHELTTTALHARLEALAACAGASCRE